MDDILDRAQVRKAKELAQKYVRREPDAVTLVDEIAADASVHIDDLMAKELAERLDDIPPQFQLARDLIGGGLSSVKGCGAV